MEKPDSKKLDALFERVFGDMGAVFSGVLVIIGDRLGLYTALVEGGPQTPAELAKRTNTHERYVREWLSAQAAANYIDYNPVTQRFAMSPEQAAIFADPKSPVYVAGAYDIASALYHDEPKVTEAFRTGNGVGWHEHSACLFKGTERFFRNGYSHHLIANWIPSLDGVEAKLESGAKVADVGCGHGVSTILMAQAYPKSRFFAFDFHAPSIDKARVDAEAAGVAERITFEVARAKEYPGRDYDLVAFFDCLHDMGDPVGAAAHVRTTLADGGTWMLIEPRANDALEDNLNPVGRLFYSASTMVCTPASLAQEVGLGLGAQAGEARLRDVLSAGGFTHVRRAAETPTNMVLEVRP